MIDHHGRTWLTVQEAARAVRVRPGTIRVWVTRGTVRGLLVAGHRYVRLDDVQRAERAWRSRMVDAGKREP